MREGIEPSRSCEHRFPFEVSLLYATELLFEMTEIKSATDNLPSDTSLGMIGIEPIAEIDF
jgi:hypothetical protein